MQAFFIYRGGCMNLEREQYQQTAKLIQKMMPSATLAFGTITAFFAENRTVKVMIEPSGIETGWCKCLQGAYADKIGLEVLLGRVIGENAQQYVVLGIIK